MTTDDTIDWLGQSGKTYRYWFLASPEDPKAIKDQGGNYAFVKKFPNGRFVPLYFGQADSLRNRIPSHEGWAAARRLGVTHVMSHITPAGDTARREEEADLIRHWNPPLNVQHRTAG